MIDDKYLLTDVDMARFLVTGYHIVEPDLPPGLNSRIADKLDELAANPGDAITEEVPDLWQVVEHPQVRGALVSLLGEDYTVNSHRHWHCKLPGSGAMQWHQDGTNNRNTQIDRLLGLYYPHEITADMGPTVIVPATQFRNAPTDRMATYSNIRGQVPLTVKAGTVAFTHYDLWHGTASNRSSIKRHMIKFLFNRASRNAAPSWSHDPEALNRPRDWDARDKAQDAVNILSFGNPLGVSQSDHYKERTIRQECWHELLGQRVAN